MLFYEITHIHTMSLFRDRIIEKWLDGEVSISDFLIVSFLIHENFQNNNKSRNEKIINRLKSEADLNNKDAQGYLGYLYLYGIGTEYNINEAIKYLKLGANQGCKRSWWDLGEAYLNIKNYEEALKCYEIALVEYGHPVIEDIVDVHTYIYKDYVTAFRFLREIPIKHPSISDDVHSFLAYNDHIIVETFNVLKINRKKYNTKILEQDALIEHIKLCPGTDPNKIMQDYELMK